VFQLFTVCAVLCFAAAGIAWAGEIEVPVAFPTAGDAYCSATNGCGTIPIGGQTVFQWTTGDYVESSIFVLPTDFVDDLTANWNFQDFLGGGNSETWNIYVNGVEVAFVALPDDNHVGDTLNVSGATSFAPIAAAAGGFQVELILQNTVPSGGGSVAWMDGGVTNLSYTETATPEPGSLLLIGSGLALGGMMLRRKRRA
jgi:hypothetical protein